MLSSMEDVPPTMPAAGTENLPPPNATGSKGSPSGSAKGLMGSPSDSAKGLVGSASAEREAAVKKKLEEKSGTSSPPTNARKISAAEKARIQVEADVDIEAQQAAKEEKSKRKALEKEEKRQKAWKDAEKSAAEDDAKRKAEAEAKVAAKHAARKKCNEQLEKRNKLQEEYEKEMAKIREERNRVTDPKKGERNPVARETRLTVLKEEAAKAETKLEEELKKLTEADKTELAGVGAKDALKEKAAAVKGDPEAAKKKILDEAAKELAKLDASIAAREKAVKARADKVLRRDGLLAARKKGEALPEEDEELLEESDDGMGSDPDSDDEDDAIEQLQQAKQRVEDKKEAALTYLNEKTKLRKESDEAKAKTDAQVAERKKALAAEEAERKARAKEGGAAAAADMRKDEAMRADVLQRIRMAKLRAASDPGNPKFKFARADFIKGLVEHKDYSPEGPVRQRIAGELLDNPPKLGPKAELIKAALMEILIAAAKASGGGGGEPEFHAALGKDAESLSALAMAARPADPTEEKMAALHEKEKDAKQKRDYADSLAKIRAEREGAEAWYKEVAGKLLEACKAVEQAVREAGEAAVAAATDEAKEKDGEGPIARKAEDAFNHWEWFAARQEEAQKALTAKQAEAEKKAAEAREEGIETPPAEVEAARQAAEEERKVLRRRNLVEGYATALVRGPRPPPVAAARTASAGALF